MLQARPEKIVLRGHTDSRPYKSGTYDDWRLSTDRANLAIHLIRGGLRREAGSSNRGLRGHRAQVTAGPEGRRRQAHRDPAAGGRLLVRRLLLSAVAAACLRWAPRWRRKREQRPRTGQGRSRLMTQAAKDQEKGYSSQGCPISRNVQAKDAQSEVDHPISLCTVLAGAASGPRCQGQFASPWLPACLQSPKLRKRCSPRAMKPGRPQEHPQHDQLCAEQRDDPRVSTELLAMKSLPEECARR